MTGIFDGMAAALNDVFGAEVTHLPKAGAPRVIRAVFRMEPVETSDEMGRAILVMAPLLKVSGAAADGIQRGDVIRPGPGAQYLVLNRQASGSPASDAFTIFELEKDLT